ncbi:hypothetical protein HPB51_015074 [Rhipicephalus microplus]|uniref:Uncharacterized protein n=1 Tax=Rhipicephalus microplus TaxID=6941 RepID=A0A9J6EU75_RHIMP|nr:hypothetical protein HPB51_015074 [Rhipicephalus microplus]
MASFADESIGDVELATRACWPWPYRPCSWTRTAPVPVPRTWSRRSRPSAPTNHRGLRPRPAVAAMRLRHNSQLMTMLLTDDSRIPGPSLEDWSKSYQVLLTKRTILEERVRAAEQEIRDIRSLHEAKRSQLLKDAEKFRADLLKCGQEEHLRKVYARACARYFPVKGLTKRTRRSASACGMLTWRRSALVLVKRVVGAQHCVRHAPLPWRGRCAAS